MTAAVPAYIPVRIPNHLGDACMALPALDLLTAAGLRPVIVGKAWAASLLAAYPFEQVACPRR